jgi:hypothetical protein
MMTAIAEHFGKLADKDVGNDVVEARRGFRTADSEVG